jgi:hypothetical protein
MDGTRARRGDWGARRQTLNVKYVFIAWCIVPNHVHAVIEIWQTPLAGLFYSWKSYTSKQAGKVLGRTGHFWQDEYFDCYIRDQAHLREAIRCTENNPVKALARQRSGRGAAPAGGTSIAVCDSTGRKARQAMDWKRTRGARGLRAVQAAIRWQGARAARPRVLRPGHTIRAGGPPALLFP